MARYLAFLKNTERNSFELVGREIAFALRSVRNCDMDVLEIRTSWAVPWDEWAAGFLNSPHFVMAWLADTKYQFWQNAEDPLEYVAAGRPFEHLSTKSNDLPPPLSQMIIDISSNPGRRLLRNGYYEVVGAVMWLGKQFWALTDADRSEVERASWIQKKAAGPNALRIEVAPKCFDTAEGVSGEIQRKLRDVLFP